MPNAPFTGGRPPGVPDQLLVLTLIHACELLRFVGCGAVTVCNRSWEEGGDSVLERVDVCVCVCVCVFVNK